MCLVDRDRADTEKETLKPSTINWRGRWHICIYGVGGGRYHTCILRTIFLTVTNGYEPRIDFVLPTAHALLIWKLIFRKSNDTEQLIIKRHAPDPR
jgi:hypothetical protein